MGLKLGFKRTEVGVIPEEWEDINLGKIAEIRMCKRIFAEQTNPSGDIPFFKIGTFGKTPDAFISCNLYREYKRKYSFPEKGDILLSAAGTLGKTVIYDGQDAYFQDSNIVWLEIDPRKVTNEYLYHCYHAIKWASPEGSTISRLYNGIIRNTRIPLPPTEEEQRAIATALRDTDALLDGLDQLIAKKRDLKQATMQQLLTGKTRLPGFEGEWKTVQVGEFGTTYAGLTGKTKSDFWVGQARYVTFLNVLENVVVDPSRYEQVHVGSRECQNQIRYGDILFNGTSETPDDLAIAAVMQTDEENIFLNSFCFGFKVHDTSENLPLFLAYYFRGPSGRRIMRSLAQGATRYNISKKQFLALSLSLPPSDEQKAIATILSDIDAEIAGLEVRLEKAQNLKQAMMQELLTGKTRLVTPEESNV